MPNPLQGTLAAAFPIATDTDFKWLGPSTRNGTASVPYEATFFHSFPHCPSPEAVEKLNRDDPDQNPQPKTRAERAFHLGGAGAWDRCPPAHASCWKDRNLNFFTAPRAGARGADTRDL
jgi:hypothetical protein